MKISHPKYNHKDARGEIIDVLSRDRIEYVTLITSAKGAVRGNHYHKATVQMVYLLRGRMQLLTQWPDQPVVETILEKGDLAVTDPLERHAMVALEDAEFMVFTRGVRGGEDYEKDTYRLLDPLKAASPVSTGAAKGPRA